MRDKATDLEKLIAFAREHNLFVTSVCGCGKHNIGSKHYSGSAIDVRTRNKTEGQIAIVLTDAATEGIRAVDERKRRPGQDVWSGPHLHLEVKG